MGPLTKISSMFNRFERDESGAFSMIWAICLVAFLGVLGAAVDFALLSHAHSRAQSVGDTTALTAAIYVKNHEVIPTDRTKGLIGDYTAQELGYDFKNWVIEGGSGVSVNVAYDLIEREAIVTTTGNTRPLFVQLFGYQQLGFNTRTVVKFFEKEPLDPASIVLVMDNSGSMFFDDMPLENGIPPTEANIRMDGLKLAANNFMTQLDDLVGPQVESPDVPRVLRTGMITFDTAAREDAPMAWGVVKKQIIDDMEPRGGTDSSLPLGTAQSWLTGTANDEEPKVHQDENSSATPLKYLILMTDGRNTVGDEVWVAREGTQNWRAWVQTGSHMEFIDELEIVDAFVPGGDCRITNGHPYAFYTYTYSWGGVFAGHTTQRVECNKQVEVPDFGWEYLQQTDEPTEAGDWEEGEFDIQSNLDTRKKCDELHAAGVEIFSIGFALEPGQYETNDWENKHMCNYTPYRPTNALVRNGCSTVPAYSHETAVKNANIAEGLLQYCANKDENFLSADDTKALEAAFEKIGNTIVKEIIRIDS